MFTPQRLEVMGLPFSALLAKIHQDTDGCWVWRGPRSRDGNAIVHTPPMCGNPGRVISTRRIMSEFAGRSTTPGINVRFRCGNPRCVNPEHEAMPGERRPTKVRRGSAHSRAKLTETQVREIRARVNNGAVQAQLAREFNVSTATISYIRNGKGWAGPVDPCVRCMTGK